MLLADTHGQTEDVANLRLYFHTQHNNTYFFEIS